MATGFGLRPVGKLGGGEPRVSTYYVPSTDSTALFVGDVVQLVNAMDPKNEVSVVAASAVDSINLGVIVGFEVDASNPYATHRVASTNRYVKVCDDPRAVYEVQEDAVGGSVSAANVGEKLNISMIVAAGSAVTGLSGVMADSSTVAATAKDFKIVGVRRDGSNAAAQSGGAILQVTILAPALLATDSDS